MRILILHFLPESDKSYKILKNLEIGANKNSHEVNIVDGTKDMTSVHVQMYDYIAVVTISGILFSAKPPITLGKVFSSLGNIAGKKGCALVVKSGFLSSKTCQLLMIELEKNGMLLDYFDIIESAQHATDTGRKLG